MEIGCALFLSLLDNLVNRWRWGRGEEKRCSGQTYLINVFKPSLHRGPTFRTIFLSSFDIAAIVECLLVALVFRNVISIVHI